RVTCGGHEPVPACPVVVGGIGVHRVLGEQVRHWRETDRRPRVAVTLVLHGVGGKYTNSVHGTPVEIGPTGRGGRGCVDVHRLPFISPGSGAERIGVQVPRGVRWRAPNAGPGSVIPPTLPTSRLRPLAGGRAAPARAVRGPAHGPGEGHSSPH